jgi:hypothetical protein
MSGLLFIDTNQYLKLYGVVKGKDLLKALDEQKDDIFISTHIVDEVRRNQLKCASDFLAKKLNEVPDHLFGIDLPREQVDELRDAFKRAEEAEEKHVQPIAKLLSQIMRSEDEVSTQLTKLFDGRAIAPSRQECRRATIRKERGNSPGKPNGPLGDQLIWEQLLSFCRKRNKEARVLGKLPSFWKERIWLITRDGDYFPKNQSSLLLNAFLYRELKEACGSNVEVHCFDDLREGLKDFGRHNRKFVAFDTKKAFDLRSLDRGDLGIDPAPGTDPRGWQGIRLHDNWLDRWRDITIDRRIAW